MPGLFRADTLWDRSWYTKQHNMAQNLGSESAQYRQLITILVLTSSINYEFKTGWSISQTYRKHLDVYEK